MKQKEMIERVNQLLSDVGECTFAIITEDGYPHAAIRSFCETATIEGGFISTNTSGNLSQSVRKNQKASICIRKDGNNITLIGTAKVVEDMDIKRRLWLDWFINHYPGGAEDEEFCIIEFKTERVSLWIDRQVVKFSL